MRRALAAMLLHAVLLASPAAWADWQAVGKSVAGEYFIDPDTVQMQPEQRSFTIMTRVVQADGGVWNTQMQVDCANKQYRYLRGGRTFNKREFDRFDQPQSVQAIAADSLPDQLRQAYCEAAAASAQADASPASNSAEPQWELLATSKQGEVYFDPASLLRSTDQQAFRINTRVIKPAEQETSLSTLSFDCASDTFRILSLSQIRQGKPVQVFGRAQAPVPTSRTETLGRLSDMFCAKAAALPASSAATISSACQQQMDKLKKLEVTIQKAVDSGKLACSQSMAFIQDLQGIAQHVRQQQCPVGDLSEYIQSVGEVECRK
ncbi:surface-adhesin E family protein [Methylobacillus flagellatus]|uniref:surface-adhesin E family protein n=1 Tax=Methylobacillus flagellatus TaxID=405 RepID=UPI0010FA3A15|nr:surface-adhesin E family protein [Methylobacillus flagellatus]